MTESIKRCNESEKELFFYKSIIASVSSVIIEMSPYIDAKRLEKLNNIILALSDKFSQSNIYPKNSESESHYLYMTKESFKEWLNDSLFEIIDFKNLNLSYNEELHGISLYDINRLQYDFETDSESEHWKNEFTDLDECVRKIYLDILRKNKDVECSLCIHSQDDSNSCNECTNNPIFKNYYQYGNVPYSDLINRWCSNGCGDSIAVCCYDCNHKDNCADRCCGSYFIDSDITCSALIYRDKGKE